MIRNPVELPGPLRDDPDHLVDGDPPGGRLEGEMCAGGAEIVLGGRVRLVVPQKAGARDTEGEHRRGLRPGLVPLDEAREQSLGLGRVLAGRNDVAPGLLVVRGRRPARGFEERAEILQAHVSVCERVGAEALGDELLHGMVGVRELDGHHCLLLLCRVRLDRRAARRCSRSI